MNNDNKTDAVNSGAYTEDNPCESTSRTADTAEADKISAATDLGKFKSVEALKKAYSDLEAEFTRRSQRLKELEKESNAHSAPDGERTAPSRPSDEQLVTFALENAKVKDAVLSQYLKSVAENKPVALTQGGGGVAAPRNTPKSVKEAGRMAIQFLKN